MADPGSGFTETQWNQSLESLVEAELERSVLYRMPSVRWTLGALSTELLSPSRRLSTRRFSSDALRSDRVRRRSRNAERRKNLRASIGFPCSLWPFKRLMTDGAALLGFICTKP